MCSIFSFLFSVLDTPTTKPDSTRLELPAACNQSIVMGSIFSFLFSVLDTPTTKPDSTRLELPAACNQSIVMGSIFSFLFSVVRNIIKRIFFLRQEMSVVRYTEPRCTHVHKTMPANTDRGSGTKYH